MILPRPSRPCRRRGPFYTIVHIIKIFSVYILRATQPDLVLPVIACWAHPCWNMKHMYTYISRRKQALGSVSGYSCGRKKKQKKTGTAVQLGPGLAAALRRNRYDNACFKAHARTFREGSHLELEWDIFWQYLVLLYLPSRRLLTESTHDSSRRGSQK